MGDVISIDAWKREKIDRVSIRLVEALLQTPDHQLTRKGRRLKAECLSAEKNASE